MIPVTCGTVTLPTVQGGTQGLSSNCNKRNENNETSEENNNNNNNYKRTCGTGSGGSAPSSSFYDASSPGTLI